jgi:hypothetical protein
MILSTMAQGGYEDHTRGFCRSGDNLRLWQVAWTSLLNLAWQDQGPGSLAQLTMAGIIRHPTAYTDIPPLRIL